MKMQLGAARPAAESARGLYQFSGYMAPLGLLLCGQDDRPYLSPNQPKWRNERGGGREEVGREDEDSPEARADEAQ